MENLRITIFQHEKQALIDALRRDMRMEMMYMETLPELRHHHYKNARLNLRLLELIEPFSDLTITDSSSEM